MITINISSVDHPYRSTPCWWNIRNALCPLKKKYVTTKPPRIITW